MVFDPGEPQDTTKIRNLGTVIRPNWLAIQDGDSTFKPKGLNLQNRTPLAEPNDPAAIADTNILYVKDDASANPELFMMDESSNAIQLTTGVPTIGATGQTSLPGGLIMKWGTDATAASGGTVTFGTAFPTGILQVQITAERNNNTDSTGHVKTKTAANFEWRKSSSSASLLWIAIGY